MPIEIYKATMGSAVGAAMVANDTSAQSQASEYTIEVRFIGGLTDRQKSAFKKAANRWTEAIVGDLPDVLDEDGKLINNLVILAQGAPIDGAGRILGQAGPTRLRPANGGSAAYLPAKGEMTFDSADLAKMEADGTLDDVIAHEMGHVIGIGTIWSYKGLLMGAGGSNPTFIGKAAQREFGALKGQGPTPVPVESHGGRGTRDSHWDDQLFKNELMTGYVSNPPNPLSRLTIASLEDLGYTVNYDAAESYELSDGAAVMAMHPSGSAEHTRHACLVLSAIPILLPDDHLV